MHIRSGLLNGIQYQSTGGRTKVHLNGEAAPTITIRQTYNSDIKIWNISTKK